MAGSVGVRIYQISMHKKGDRKPLQVDTADAIAPPSEFLANFASRHSTVVQDAEDERSWYFEQKVLDKQSGSSKGYVRYGTYGFESDFVDTQTRARNYRRKTTDIEEIPLFYEFWFPKGEQYAFAVFQSFHGRSCITRVMSKIQSEFELANDGHFSLRFKKLLPNDPAGGIYRSAPVKALRLIKKNASGDLADKYLGSEAPAVVDFELTITAKRKGSLGVFGALTGSLKDAASGLVTHDGISFDDAVAEIQVGGRRRRVGVFGINTDAGVIDLSDAVKRGPDGHPTFDSLVKESNDLLKDCYATISGRPS
jgi:hypothetical protein